MTSVDDFYKYLSENGEQIKYELRKNITFDDELFEDVYNDTVVKVYEAIAEKGKEVEDIRMYFFISFKFNYIQSQAKQRKHKSRKSVIEPYTLDITDTEYSEEYPRRINDFFNYIREELEKKFEPFEVDLFIIYYKLKCGKGKISYRKLSNITGLSMSVVVSTIQKLREYVKGNEQIIEKKKRLND